MDGVMLGNGAGGGSGLAGGEKGGNEDEAKKSIKDLDRIAKQESHHDYRIRSAAAFNRWVGVRLSIGIDYLAH